MWSFIITHPISGYAFFGHQVFNVYTSDLEVAARKLYKRLLKDHTYTAYLEGFDEETFLDEVLQEGGMRLHNGLSINTIHRDDVIEL